MDLEMRAIPRYTDYTMQRRRPAMGCAHRALKGGQMDTRESKEAADPGGRERRKRYYSPSEVRKRKGCIGCGGAGVIATLILALALGIALL